MTQSLANNNASTFFVAKATKFCVWRHVLNKSKIQLMNKWVSHILCLKYTLLTGDKYANYT